MTELTLSSRPLRVDHVGVQRAGDDSEVLLRPEGADQVFVLNETAFALWELCDGSTAVHEMVAAASELFAASPESLEHDVLAALHELAQDGLVADVSTDR